MVLGRLLVSDTYFHRIFSFPITVIYKGNDSEFIVNNEDDIFSLIEVVFKREFIHD